MTKPFSLLDYGDDEPEYEDVDENGDVPMAKKKTMMENALSPNTELERAALGALHRKYFESPKIKKLFKKYEEAALGADPTSRIWKAWMESRILLAAKYHWRIGQLMSSFGNKVLFDKFQAENKDKILAKPSVEDLTQRTIDRMEELHGNRPKPKTTSDY